jgi:hypothetical protein
VLTELAVPPARPDGPLQPAAPPLPRPPSSLLLKAGECRRRTPHKIV